MNNQKEQIEIMQTGVVAREEGDYQTGENLLKQAFQEAIKGTDQETAVEVANQYAIQCRLIAGRRLRQEGNDAARKFSKKSLDIYQQLKDKNWFDLTDPDIVRNYAHALLYAGQFQKATLQLQNSAQLMEEGAKGDEFSHLAAAYLGLGQYQTAQANLEKGLRLIEENNGHPIWHTFALMVKASLQSTQGEHKTAKKTLKKALSIAQKHDLAVREEEIEFLLNQKTSQINVLNAVAVQ